MIKLIAGLLQIPAASFFEKRGDARRDRQDARPMFGAIAGDKSRAMN